MSAFFMVLLPFLTLQAGQAQTMFSQVDLGEIAEKQGKCSLGANDADRHSHKSAISS